MSQRRADRAKHATMAKLARKEDRQRAQFHSSRSRQNERRRGTFAAVNLALQNSPMAGARIVESRPELTFAAQLNSLGAHAAVKQRPRAGSDR